MSETRAEGAYLAAGNYYQVLSALLADILAYHRRLAELGQHQDTPMWMLSRDAASQVIFPSALGNPTIGEAARTLAVERARLFDELHRRETEILEQGRRGGDLPRAER